MAGLEMIDWIVIGTYFLVLVGVVWWSSRKQDTATDYFLAGRNIGWFAIGASLFASNIGSEHVVGLAGNCARNGMAMAHWELHAWCLLMLGWVFVPFYYRSGIFTMPEYLERRFGSTARWILSVISLIAYVMTKVSVTVYAGALVFETLLPDIQYAFWIGAFVTVILTGVYTIFGGLRAVVYTDAAQAVILVVGSAAIAITGLNMVGGWEELQSVCRGAATNFNLWRPIDAEEFPWLGILIASPIVGIWYWCTDQYIVQRTLAAKDLKTARRGTIWGAFMKLSPVFIFMIPGIVGYALHCKGLLEIPYSFDETTGDFILGNGNQLQNRGDQVFPKMVQYLLPAGLRGLVVGGLLAALMSSLSSLFNSASALFTVDIYEKLHPRASERTLVRVGRLATAVLVGAGLLWIPVMKLVSGGGLYKYLQSVQGYLAPPITAVFLLGLFSKRINSVGAVFGLAAGFLCGIGKLTIQTLEGAGMFSDIPLLKAIGSYNFLYATGWLFLISVLCAVIGSLLSRPQDPEKISGLTYAVKNEEFRKENRASWNRWDVIATMFILCIVLGVYVYFSFWLDGSSPRSTMWKFRNGLVHGNTNNVAEVVEDGDARLRAACRYGYFVRAYNLAVDRCYGKGLISPELTGLEPFTNGRRIDRGVLSEDGNTTLFDLADKVELKNAKGNLKVELFHDVDPLVIVERNGQWKIKLSSLSGFGISDADAIRLRAEAMGMQAGMCFMNSDDRARGYYPDRIMGEVCRPVRDVVMAVIKARIADEAGLLKLEGVILGVVKEHRKNDSWDVEAFKASLIEKMEIDW